MSPERAIEAPLRAVLRRLPTTSGVYLMKSADGRVLYVGKADSLRGRVRSYFAARGPEDARIARMVTQVANVEYIVT
ncbi:MAG: GIY-YIG nuclease family protein, partial [Candidatus Limnocylindria bacterium]